MCLAGLSFVLFATTSVAAVDNPPQQKGGKWQIVQLGDHGINSNDVTTLCFADQSVLAKFRTMPHCSSKQVHTDGAVTTADARCRMLDSVMSYHEKIMKLDDDNYYTYIHATFSPPTFRGTDIEQAELILFNHLKRLGPCRPGERPIKY